MYKYYRHHKTVIRIQDTTKLSTVIATLRWEANNNSINNVEDATIDEFVSFMLQERRTLKSEIHELKKKLLIQSTHV